MELTYKLVYNPNIETRVDVNFLCSDNKIHIRLRDYDKPEIITGFIDKLTYITTYLIKRYADISIEDFMKEDRDFVYLAENLGYALGAPKYKGVAIYPNYRKIKTSNPMGSFVSGTAPMFGSLDDFCNTLNVSLSDFLFNDGYSIVIEKEKEDNYYIKFDNKRIRKANTKELEYIPLV